MWAALPTLAGFGGAVTTFNFRQRSLQVARVFQERLAGELVQYQRGSDSVSGGLTATIGRTTDRGETQESVNYEFDSVDWIIKRSDLVLNAVEVEPQPGDRIVWVQGSTTLTFQVLPIEDDRCWQPHDEFNVSMRVHTKLFSKV